MYTRVLQKASSKFFLIKRKMLKKQTKYFLTNNEKMYKYFFLNIRIKNINKNRAYKKHLEAHYLWGFFFPAFC